MNQDIIEILRGAAAGLTQVIVGHPFDTYKVWRQSGYDLSYGIPYTRLYNGVAAPLVGNTVINSVFFGLSHFLHEHTGNWLISGAIAGTAGSFISNPFDVWKINRQLHKKETKNTVRQNLLRFPMYRGLQYSMLREGPAMALYFYVYHKLRDNYNFHPGLAGAMTGVTGWIVTYPVDVVKTRIQASSTMTLKQALAMGNFWHGLNTVIVRAFIVNGTSFWVYNKLVEKTSK